MKTEKNRNRSDYSYANINFLGKCNLNCFFCLGKDLEKEFSQYNYTQVHFSNFKNLQSFLDLCKEKKVNQLYLTGQNVDPLQYAYLNDFRRFLQDQEFYVGIRTNGVLVLPNIDYLNKFNTCKRDAVGFTMLTLNRKKMFLMTNHFIVPNWIYIFNQMKVPFRVSIVVTTYNLHDIMNLINFISCFTFNPNLKYVQLRKISTDYRDDVLKDHIDAFGEIKRFFEMSFYCREIYEKAPIYRCKNLDVVLWETKATSINSLNYFVNGVISDEYFIIEGYEKNSIEKIDVYNDMYIN